MHDIRPFLPQLFNDPGSLLYIGCRVDAHSWLDELYRAGNEITVMEVWPDNASRLLTDARIKRIITGDVREAGRLLDTNFDYIFWWHGPEHLRQSEIMPTLQTLTAKCNRLIALACPWGIYPQGAHEGNPYEIHRATLYPNFFEWLGYEVRTDGKADEPGGEIVAWKVINA